MCSYTGSVAWGVLLGQAVPTFWPLSGGVSELGLCNHCHLPPLPNTRLTHLRMRLGPGMRDNDALLLGELRLGVLLGQAVRQLPNFWAMFLGEGSS